VQKTILAILLFTTSVAVADDQSEAEAKVREYFDVFNSQDVERIVETVYSVPVHIGNSSGHRAYVTEHDARSGLTTLFGQIEDQGWVRSVISEVKPCSIANGLVFAEVTYTRQKSDGSAIAPGTRRNVYVLQNLSGGWRITAFYSQDPTKRFTCKN